MKCPKCGFEFDEGPFCPECGARVDEVIEQEASVSPWDLKMDSEEDEQVRIDKERIETEKQEKEAEEKRKQDEEKQRQAEEERKKQEAEKERLKEQKKQENKGRPMAILSLICGIIGLITFGSFYIPEILGIIFAFFGKKDGKMRGIAKVGLVCSIIGTVIVLALWVIVLFVA